MKQCFTRFWVVQVLIFKVISWEFSLPKLFILLEIAILRPEHRIIFKRPSKRRMYEPRIGLAYAI